MIRSSLALRSMRTGTASPCSSEQRGPRRELAAQIPTNAGGADEAEEGDARIGGEPFGQRVVLRDEGLAPRFREARLPEQGDQLQAAQRRWRSRLDDHGTPDGDGRRGLMDDQAERVVERRDRGDDPDRLSGGESPTSIARRREPIGISRPAKLRISSAALRKRSTAQTASILASVSGFPPSCAMSRANASSL